MRLRILGAVIAGGRSSRFGSDKAEAHYRGRKLIDYVISGLAAQTDALVVCGRCLDGHECLADRPRSGLGPLGGLAAALNHAEFLRFDGVLTSACDTPLVPADLSSQLAGDEPAIVVGQPLFGYWPAGLLRELDDFLGHSEQRAVRDWALWAGARRVRLDCPVPNINTPGDLRSLCFGAAVA